MSWNMVVSILITNNGDNNTKLTETIYLSSFLFYISYVDVEIRIVHLKFKSEIFLNEIGIEIYHRKKISAKQTSLYHIF